MNKRTCVKCGSTLTTFKYEYDCKLFGAGKEWLKFTCIECEYVWKEPTLDSEKNNRWGI